ncbi:MAG TPA: DUF6544 family protein [Chryseolinea sp.]
MIILLFIIGLLQAILLIAKINSSLQFRKEVRQLFAQSKTLSNKTFSNTQLAGLPEPLQRYFRHVLRNGQAYISHVRLTHDGQFKPGLEKKWTNITGEQYFTTVTPGFIWKGTTALFTARDMYIGDKGRLVVWIASLFKVADGQGKNYDEGELQRWLAESVWFPTNLLPSERIVWEPIDSNAAKMIFTTGTVTIFFTVTINALGEITQMETLRYMDNDKKQTWLCSMSDYKERNGIIIPFHCEATWRLERGDYPYAKFDVKTIEYDHPKMF